MTRVVNLRVRPEDAGMRVDRLLALRMEEFSRSALKRMMGAGYITLEGKPVAPHHMARDGENFIITEPEAAPARIESEDIPLDIVYEDADVAVVNKAAGMVVHPARGHCKGTLVNALLFHLKESLSGIGGEMRPGIVHRLDKGTSGLIAVAKNDFAHRSLSEQLKSRTMGREYLALVRGMPPQKHGTIKMPIGRHPVHRKKISVKTGKPRDAVTEYRILEIFIQSQPQHAAYVRVKLHTGRTHQIRVHFSAIGCPLMGDTVYGKDNSRIINRVALHAELLAFIHPATGESKTFIAPPPEDFLELLDALRRG
ncbi:MAG: pseudouridine synthase [bacterium]|nr:MAG: pseudouridine synthase [bacterium]